MDWIRRNWPDLLIGIALLAVIAGIIATLLNGGSLFPFGNQNSPIVQEPSSPVQNIPNTDALGNLSAAGTIAEPESTATGEGVVAVDPVDPLGQDTSSEVPVISSLEDGPTEVETSTPTPEVAPEPVSAVAPAPTSSNESMEMAAAEPYRIAVGSYRDAVNAERRAAAFADLGYPVFTGEQGDLSIVLVGPYSNRGEAEQALNQIRASGLEPNPQLFVFQEDSSVAAESVSSMAASPIPATGGQGENYIQVGAYGSIDSSMPQQQRLETLGFTVSQLEEGSFVKLLIGPFASSDLTVVQDRLNDQGINHFVRSR